MAGTSQKIACSVATWSEVQVGFKFKLKVVDSELLPAELATQVCLPVLPVDTHTPSCKFIHVNEQAKASHIPSGAEAQQVLGGESVVPCGGDFDY